MEVKALPSELLDEHELHERYRSIDNAACEVRSDIERKIKSEGYKVVPAKLNFRKLKQAHA